MNKILQAALMRHHNDFFKMSKEEQEIFKLQDHDELDEKISAFVMKELDYSEDETSPEKQFEYNKIMLPYRGIGNNNFMLNEFDWNEKILKYKNLYEYNEDCHNWQEDACKSDENFPNYKPTKLYNRFCAWARAEINGEFNYLNLNSIQIWIQWALEEFSSEWIEKEIPHEYVSGPNDGKKTKGGYMWDMRIDANGLEGWYEQINDFHHKWMNEKFNNHVDELDKVYLVDRDEGEFDPGKDYIFGSMNILKQITFKNFLADCEKFKGDVADIEACKESAVAEFKTALENELIEIKKTPANMMKLKKKRKVVMADSFIEDLNNIEE